MQEAGFEKLASKCFKKVVRSSKRIWNNEQNSLVLADIARVMARGGRKKRSAKVFNKAFKIAAKVRGIGYISRVKALTDVASVMVAAEYEQQANKCMDEALKTADKIDEHHDQIEAFSCIAEAFLWAGYEDEAEACFYRMFEIEGKDSYAKNQKQVNIIKVLAKVGQFPKALKVANEIPFLPYAIYNNDFIEAINESLTQLKGLNTSYDSVYTWQFIEPIIGGITQTKGLNTDLPLLNQTVEAARDLRDMGDKLEVFTATALAMENAGYKDQAGRCLNQAKGYLKMAMVEQEKVDNAQIAKNTAHIAASLASAGNEKTASTFLHQALIFSGFNYNALVSVCEILREAENLKNRSQIIKQVLWTSEKISDALGRMKILDEVSIVLKKDDYLENISSLLEQVLESVENVEENVENENIKVWVLRSIVEAMFQRNDVEDRLSLLQRVLKIAKSFRLEKSKALFRITAETAEAGEFQQALSIAEFIENKEEKLFALKCIADALESAENLEGYSPLLDQMMNMTNAIEHENSFMDKMGISLSICSAMVKAGCADKATRFFRNSLKKIETMKDVFEKRQLLSLILQSLRRAHGLIDRSTLFQQVMSAAYDIENSKSIVELLLDVAEAFKETGDEIKTKQCLNRALNVAEVIEYDLFRCEALLDVAKAMAKAGEQVKVKQCFNHALSTAEAIGKNSGSKSIAFSKIALAFSKTGNLKKALHYFKKALIFAEKGIKLNENLFWKKEAVESILNCLAEANELEDRLTLLKQVWSIALTNDDIINNWFLKAMCEAFLQEGYFQEALETAGKAYDKGVDITHTSVILYGIASNMAQAGKEDHFSEHLIGLKDSHRNYSIEFIPRWQQILLKNCPSRMDLIKNTFVFSVYDQGLAYQVCVNFIRGLITNGRLTAVEKIACMCPQLGLDFIVEDDTCKTENLYESYCSYNNLSEWICCVQDEDDRYDIKGWANRVVKGKMTEEEFNQKVQEVID